jgi:hypothetical protein
MDMHATIKRHQLVAFLGAIGVSLGLWIVGIGSVLAIGGALAPPSGAGDGKAPRPMIVASLAKPTPAKPS